MSWMFGGDEACYATGAFANGQIVRVDGRTVKEVAIPASLLSRVQEVLDEWGGGYLCLYDPWELGKIAYVTRESERLRNDPPPTYGDITWVLPRVLDFPTPYVDGEEPAYVKANIQTTCPAVDRPALTEFLRKEVPELGFVSPSVKAAVIDIIPLGWNKGDGVRVLVDALGLAPSELVAFGDSENDLAMIEAVENSVAVANASAAVAKRARWHIGLCDEGAVDGALLDIAAAAVGGRMPVFMGGM